jgi:hypothetical protein
MPGTSRNSSGSDFFTLTKINTEAEFDLTAHFDCGNADLNDFFQNDAIVYKQHLVAETYYLHHSKAAEEGLIFPVAFISFSNDVINAGLPTVSPKAC